MQEEKKLLDDDLKIRNSCECIREYLRKKNEILMQYPKVSERFNNEQKIEVSVQVREINDMLLTVFKKLNEYKFTTIFWDQEKSKSVIRSRLLSVATNKELKSLRCELEIYCVTHMNKLWNVFLGHFPEEEWGKNDVKAHLIIYYNTTLLGTISYENEEDPRKQFVILYQALQFCIKWITENFQESEAIFGSHAKMSVEVFSQNCANPEFFASIFYLILDLSIFCLNGSPQLEACSHAMLIFLNLLNIDCKIQKSLKYRFNNPESYPRAVLIDDLIDAKNTKGDPNEGFFGDKKRLQRIKDLEELKKMLETDTLFNINEKRRRKMMEEFYERLKIARVAFPSLNKSQIMRIACSWKQKIFFNFEGVRLLRKEDRIHHLNFYEFGAKLMTRNKSISALLAMHKINGNSIDPNSPQFRTLLDKIKNACWNVNLTQLPTVFLAQTKKQRLLESMFSIMLPAGSMEMMKEATQLLFCIIEPCVLIGNSILWYFVTYMCAINDPFDLLKVYQVENNQNFLIPDKTKKNENLYDLPDHFSFDSQIYKRVACMILLFYIDAKCSVYDNSNKFMEALFIYEPVIDSVFGNTGSIVFSQGTFYLVTKNGKVLGLIGNDLKEFLTLLILNIMSFPESANLGLGLMKFIEEFSSVFGN